MADSFSGITPEQDAIDKKIVSGECPAISKAEFDECYVSETKITPAWLIGAGVSMCRQWFGSEQRLSCDKPDFRWCEDQEESEIFISEDDNWNFEVVDKYPAIIVDMSDVSHTAENTNTILGGDSGGNTMLGHIPETGEIVFGSWDTGILGFRCFSKSRLEAWTLAWEVKSFLQTYAGPIQAAYEFMDFTVQQTTRPTRVEGHEGYLVATVPVKYSIQDSWALIKESLKVQAICPTILTDNPSD